MHTKGEKLSFGFTLTELLIGMLLASILMLAVQRYVLSQLQGLQFQRGYSQLQHSGLFAMSVLQRVLTNSGYFGCNTRDLSLPVLEPIKIYRAQGKRWRPELPVSLQGKVRQGSDVIESWRMGPPFADIITSGNMADLVTVEKTQPRFHVPQQVVFSDCRHIEMAQLIGVREKHGAQQLQSAQPLKYRDFQHGIAGGLYRDRFYVRNNKRGDNGGGKTYGLYIQRLSGNTQELVSGVEGLAASLISGNSGSEGAKLRLQLLLSSEQPTVVVPKPYTFRSKWFYPEDRDLREVWVAEVRI